MSKELTSIDELYTKYAHFYDAVFNDRDFKGQCQFFLQAAGVSEPARTLELFAGPGYHSEVFESTFGCEAWCIDKSARMRQLALHRHHILGSRYFVGDLPRALEKLPTTASFDVVIGMIFSLTYLTEMEIIDLLHLLGKRVRPGGSIFFELHGLTHVFHSGEGSAIAARTKIVRSAEAVCLWPAEKVQWERGSLTARMRVVLNWGNATRTFLSIERIYTVEDICRICQKSDIFVPNWLEADRSLFPESEIIQLIRV